MVNHSLCYTIYEFSTLMVPGVGNAGYGRYNYPKDQTPPAITRAIGEKWLAVAGGTATSDPGVLGRLVVAGSEVFAVMAVVVAGADEFDRSLPAYRYFWCQAPSGDHSWQGLAAIVTYFQQYAHQHSGQIPTYDPEDQTYTNAPPQIFPRQIVSVVGGVDLVQQVLEPVTDQERWQPSIALVKLNQSVTNAVTNQGLSWENLAWAWNVGDLERPETFLAIAPRNESFDDRLIAASKAAALAARNSGRRSQDPPHSVGEQLVNYGQTIKRLAEWGTSASMLSDAAYWRVFLEELGNLNQGLGTLSPEAWQPYLRSAGYQEQQWQESSIVSGLRAGLLLVAGLIDPSKMAGLETWLANNPKRQETFDRFHQGIYHAFWIEEADPQSPGETILKFDPNRYPHLYRNLLVGVRVWFGKLFTTYCLRGSAQGKGRGRGTQPQGGATVWGACVPWQGYLLTSLRAVEQELEKGYHSEDSRPALEITDLEPWELFRQILLHHTLAYRDQARQFTQQYHQNSISRQYRFDIKFWNDYFFRPIQDTSRSYPRWLDLWQACAPGSESPYHQAWQRWQVLFEHLTQGHGTGVNAVEVAGHLEFIPNPQSQLSSFPPPSWLKRWPAPSSPPIPAVPTVTSPQPQVSPSPPKGSAPLKSTRREIPKWGKQLRGLLPQPGSRRIPSQTDSNSPVNGADATQHLTNGGNSSSSVRGDGTQTNPQKGGLQVETKLPLFLLMGAILMVFSLGGYYAWESRKNLNLALYVLASINEQAGLKTQDQLGEKLGFDPVVLPDRLNQLLNLNNNPAKLIRLTTEEGSGSQILTSDSVQKLGSALREYGQAMGLETQGQNAAQPLATSLLCLALDASPEVIGVPRTVFPEGTPPEKQYGFASVPSCTDEVMFVERQMRIAPQRFWAGEIVQWSINTLSSELDNNTRVESAVQSYFNTLYKNSDGSVTIIYKQPLTVDQVRKSQPEQQRQLLQSFYRFVVQEGSINPLAISQTLVTYAQDPDSRKKVDDLTTAKKFRCALAEILNNQKETNSTVTTVSDETLAQWECVAPPTPNPDDSAQNPGNPTPNPAATSDFWGNAPQDVQDFVQRKAQGRQISQAAVLAKLLPVLGIDSVTVPEAVWQDKILAFQTNNDIPNADGVITEGSNTERVLETKMF
jgi:hypothetical protein